MEFPFYCNSQIDSGHARQQVSALDRRLKTTNKMLDHTCTTIGTVFRRLNCDRTNIDEQLGSAEGINDKNVMMYLGQIERTANELLMIQNFLQLKVGKPLFSRF